jgi:hypothetical protein
MLTNSPASLLPIERHWGAIALLPNQSQLFAVAVIAFALSTNFPIDEVLELLDPDCSHVSGSLNSLIESVLNDSPEQQLILMQAITASLGLSLFNQQTS